MKCSACGLENAHSSRYCEHCGNSLANDCTQTKKKISKRSIFILAGVALLAVVCLVVSLSNQKATSPHEQVLFALEQGEYQEALRLFDENRVEIDTNQKQKIVDQLICIAEATKSNYINQLESYESTIACFQELKNWGFSEVNNIIKEYQYEISNIDETRVILKTANEYFQNEDYISAIQWFSKVMPDDAEYQTAQEGLTETQNQYRKNIQSQADAIAQREEYIGAIEVLYTGLSVLANDQTLMDDIATYTDAYVEHISQEANELCNSGKYSDAIRMIGTAKTELPDSRLDSLYETCVSTFVNLVINNADKYAMEEKYALAIEEIKSALQILPGHESLHAALAKHDWTAVLYSDSNYTIVRKDVATFDSYKIQVGIMDNAGNWLVPLSSNCIFAEAIQKESGRNTLTGSKTEITSNNVAHLGEGVFIMSLGVKVRKASGVTYSVGSCYSIGSSGLTCYMLNVGNGVETSFDAVWISECSDGYMVMYNSDRYNSPFYRVDANGNINEIPVRHEVNDYNVSGYSEGLFFANGYFYDIYGNIKIDLTEYAITNAPYFVDGICLIKFQNNVGTLYQATIDKSGAFVKEPEKVNS